MPSEKFSEKTFSVTQYKNTTTLKKLQGTGSKARNLTNPKLFAANITKKLFDQNVEKLKRKVASELLGQKKAMAFINLNS